MPKAKSHSLRLAANCNHTYANCSSVAPRKRVQATGGGALSHGNAATCHKANPRRGGQCSSLRRAKPRKSCAMSLAKPGPHEPNTTSPRASAIGFRACVGDTISVASKNIQGALPAIHRLTADINREHVGTHPRIYNCHHVKLLHGDQL